MKRFASWIATGALAVGLAVGLAACQREDASMQEHLEQIDERLSAIEGKLERVAAGPAAGRARKAPARPRPKPDVTYSVPVEGAPYRGPEHAKVTVVEAFEFACPYCEQARPLVERLTEEYGDDVRVVYKNFVVHPNTATVPALAACAATEQGKFTEMEELIWEKGFKARQLDADHMKKLAQEAGLDLGRFEKDMNGAECKRRVASDRQELARVGATGTPTFFVNGRHLQRRSFAEFKKLIDEELARAEERIAAGTPVEDYYQTYVVEKGEKKL